MVAGKISVTAQTKRKVFEKIDQQASELLQFLQQYVAHKSVNPGRGTSGGSRRRGELPALVGK